MGDDESEGAGFNQMHLKPLKRRIRTWISPESGVRELISFPGVPNPGIPNAERKAGARHLTPGLIAKIYIIYVFA
jgi:hypothetical protein